MTAKGADYNMAHIQASLTFSYPNEYQPLCDRLGLDQGLPYTEHWSAGADFLGLVVEHCLREKPSVVFECSSGLSTLLLARCCQLNGNGHVWSLENGEKYAQATQAALNLYGLDNMATVLHAPLVATKIGGREFQWYMLSDLSVPEIDMLVIDGPPGFIQKHSRYPALPLLMERLNSHCTVYLDDAARADERELVAQWQADYPPVQHSFIETEPSESSTS
ncbi:MAG: class I SAM-dependent methyltransferase [gamma proteobacterium endosymbiont of Lamellibrachia anaximandri]|nr:class I SAM-dependent methyltransferase [gamma proteobacterium endosymbiont of Lamellibrachia anaximandri]